MIGSCGRASRNACTTVSPPSPESNTPRGRLLTSDVLDANEARWTVEHLGGPQLIQRPVQRTFLTAMSHHEHRRRLVRVLLHHAFDAHLVSSERASDFS